MHVVAIPAYSANLSASSKASWRASGEERAARQDIKTSCVSYCALLRGMSQFQPFDGLDDR